MLSDEEAVAIAREHTDAKAASDALLQASLSKGTTDNVTVVVVFVRSL